MVFVVDGSIYQERLWNYLHPMKNFRNRIFAKSAEKRYLSQKITLI